MRSQEEIVARLKARKKGDVFGWEWEEYLAHLDFEHAWEFLKPGATAEQWAEVTKDELRPAERIRDYMPFAWDKANGCRGISAARSLMHLVAWTWLDGKDELSRELEGDYEHYGKEKLRRVCEEYGLDADQWDDDVRVNSEEELV